MRQTAAEHAHQRRCLRAAEWAQSAYSFGCPTTTGPFTFTDWPIQDEQVVLTCPVHARCPENGDYDSTFVVHIDMRTAEVLDYWMGG